MGSKRRRSWETSRLYEYVRARELEGTIALGKQQGVYLITAQRIRTGWGYISEARWPYVTKVWPPTPPHGHKEFDNIASYYRSMGYFSIRNIDDARYLLSNGQTFQLTIPITADWHTSKDGNIPMPKTMSSSNSIGNHAICIVDYDNRNSRFIFRNSWGTRWGKEGHGYLPYSYMIKYMFEGWASLRFLDRRPRLNKSQYAIDKISTLNDIGNIVTNIAIYGHNGEKIGWCLYTIRSGYLDVEDFFIKPTYNPVNHSINLAKSLINEQKITGLPLRFWLSHCDASPKSYNHIVAVNVAAGLGLRRCPSPERWASSVWV